MTIQEFKRKFPHCDLMTQMIYPRSKGFETKLCFHNYYERVLKRPMTVDLFLFSFDDSGKMVEQKQIEVPTDESVQVTVNAKIEGLGVICAGAVPRISTQELQNSPFVMKTPQTAGFYMLWENATLGRIDSSHEWDAVNFNPRSDSQYFVCLPASPWIQKRSLFVYNSHADRKVSFQYTEGSKASVTQELAPLSGCELALTISQDQDATAKIEGPIGAPMTIEEGTSGDVHIHHS
jgi:hypothetical protein